MKSKGKELNDKEIGEELMAILTKEDEKAINRMKLLIETVKIYTNDSLTFRNTSSRKRKRMRRKSQEKKEKRTESE